MSQLLIRIPALAAMASLWVVPYCVFADDSVAITITGDVPHSCSLGFADSGIDLGNVAALDRWQTELAVSCNAPFNLSLRSERGGLANLSRPESVGSFADHVEYEALLFMPFDDGSSATISGCRSAALAQGNPCARFSSNGRTAIDQKAQLRIDFSQPKAPVLAGDYGDVITVTLAFEI